MTVANAQRAAAAGIRISQLLATEPQIAPSAQTKPLPAIQPQGRVEFDNVSFAYPGHEAEPVLQGLTMTVEPGESVAVVGATGSGKTTMASLLPRFYDIDDGAVLIDGVDVRQVDPQELRRAISIVFEDTFLFQATIFENIAFADPHASQAEVHRAARLAGAAEFIEELPAGYSAIVGERGLSLSGGQRQRLSIARSILAEPLSLIHI